MTVEMWIQEEAQIAAEKAAKETREEGIKDMLRRGKKPEEIADFCGYPIELILKVEKGISEDN